MGADEYCLGLEVLGQCGALAPLISIGEALAVAALLYAFYRFSGSLAQMRWRTRGISDTLVFSCITAGLALIFIAAVLRLFGDPWARVPVVGYPVFWEIMGGAIFAAMGLILVFYAFRRAPLKPKTAEQFLAGNQEIIATGDPTVLRDLGREIAPLVEPVTRHCREYRDRAAREGHAEPDAYTRVCFSLLETWADPRFCNAIVCWCPDTAAGIVKELTEHALHGDGAALGAELVNQAFADERSVLYREARQSGLRRQKVFLKSLFGEWTIVDSAVRPLSGWSVFRDPAITEQKVERWADAVDVALTTFLEKGKHGEAVFRMRQGLETLNHLCGAILAERDRKSAPWSSVHNPIFEIGAAFRTVIKRIRTCNLPVPIETMIEHYDVLQDETLHGAIAEELFDFFGQVCVSDDHEFLDWISMGPWKELFEEGELTSNLRALQLRVAYHLKTKLDDNLDPQRRFDPPITRLLLVRYAQSAPADGQRSPMAKYLHDYFHAQIAKQFPLLWRADRAFAEHLLPDNVDYDEAHAVLRIRHLRRETKALQLEAPPAEGPRAVLK